MNQTFPHKLRRILTENLAFLIPALLFWAFGTVWFIVQGKANVHLWFDGHHFPLGDLFFKYITHLGDGLFLIAVMLLLFILERRDKALPLLIAYLCSTALVQFIKFITPNNDRPYLYFFHRQLYRVEGVDLLAGSSFPSGHSCIAFTLFFLIATLVKPFWQKALLGTIAVLVCISRMYLNQHFYSDVIVGGMIGAAGIILTLSLYKGK